MPGSDSKTEQTKIVRTCQICPKCGSKTDELGTCGNCGFDQETGGHIFSANSNDPVIRDRQQGFCRHCAKCEAQDPAHCPLLANRH